MREKRCLSPKNDPAIRTSLAVFGTHHSISEAHLSRYLSEWDFKWNTRKMTDGERAAIVLKGAEGKRLTYRPTHEV
jgi:hypothetical protein